MMTIAPEPLLAELAALCGVESEYYDVNGGLHQTSPQTQAAILAAMGCRVETEADLRQELENRRCRPWTDLVEPVLAVPQSQLPAGWNLYLHLSANVLPPDLEIHWELKDESGQSRHQHHTGRDLRLAEVRRLGDSVYGRVLLPLPVLALGYYELQVRVTATGWQRQAQMLLIVAPDRVYLPELLAAGRRWGLSLPLYALRSSRNWGIGDCGDLREVVALGSRLRADIIGLNPLHHLGLNLKDSISPYYPTSRCFANPLYLDLSLVPEIAVCPEAQDFLAREEIQEQMESLRTNPQVQYPEVARLKDKVLKKLLAAFVAAHGPPEAPRTDRGRQFAAFLEQKGDTLRHFGVFLALSAHWQRRGQSYLTWQEWPPAYHDPRGSAVAAFAAAHRPEILEQAYAQWLLAGQLGEIQAVARQSGLTLGLYLDLAVGVNPGGFDTWVNQDIFALDIDIGAPPDDFSPLGQNWGLAPLLPQQLSRQGYRYVIDMLRANCLTGGALRIDHVMSLFRLYWIPRGASARDGAYVQYPAGDLLKVVALESFRQQTAIIGEDLGTVAPYIREQLQEYQVLSTRLFYFERDGRGACTPAAQYPKRALAAITTHDLPTLAGFWQGRDIQVRRELHLFPGFEAVARAEADRLRAKEAILTLLQDNGWLDHQTRQIPAAAPELPEAVKWGIIAHLAQTPCWLVLLNLEDIFGWLEQQNLPGTKDEYPNWRLKLPLALAEIAASPALARAAQIMAEQRGGEPKEAEKGEA